MKKIAFYITFLHILILNVNAQITNFNPSLYPVSKCSDGSLVSLDVSDTGILVVTMPINISYVPGSIVGATELSTTANTATFHVDSIGTISYKHTAICAVDETLSFTDEASLNGNSTSSSMSYNIAEAAPQITLISNVPAIASVGQLITRTATITNGGIGKVLDFFYQDIVDAGSTQFNLNSVKIGSYTVPLNQVSLSSGNGFDTLTIHITSSELMQVGNSDGYLDGNDPTIGAPSQESFNLLYEAIPLNCGSGYAINSNHRTYYGCGVLCSDLGFSSLVDIVIPTAPNLVFSSNNPMPSCIDGTTPIARTLTIVNSGGVAKDVTVNFGNFYAFSPNNGYSSWFDTASFKYSINGGPLQSLTFSNVLVNSAIWEGNTVCASAVGQPSLLDFHIPFIPAGASVLVSYNFYKCCSSNSNCPSGIDPNYKIYEEQLYIKNGNYKNACGDVTYNISQQALTYTGINHNVSLDYPSDMVNNQIENFKSEIYADWNNLTIGAGAYYEVSTTLPPGYLLQGTPNAVSGLVSWSGTTTQVGNVITTKFYLPVPVNFDIAYFEYNMNLQLQCALRTGSDPSTISQTHKFIQNGSCACERQLSCLQNAPLIHCPAPCTEGIGNLYAFTRRKNYGSPDANNDGVADAGPYDFSKMATRKAFYGDTIEYTYGGVIHWIPANGPFTNAYAETIISNYASKFTALNADVTIYSGGTLLAGPITFTPTVSGNTITTDYSSLVSALNQGDSIVTKLRVKVTDASLIQGQQEVEYTSLNKQYASRVASPTEASGNRNYCDIWAGTIRTISFYYTVDGYAPTVSGCNQAYLSNYEYFSVGTNGTSNYHQKSIRFPYEVRKHTYSNDAQFILPSSYNYTIDSAQVEYYRTAGYTSANYIKYSAPFTISGDTIKVVTKQYYAEYGGSANNPMSDDGWMVVTKLFVSSNCKTRIPAGNIGMVWNMKTNNTASVPSDYNYWWDVSQGVRQIVSAPVQLVAGGAGIQNIAGRSFQYPNVVISNQTNSNSNYSYAYFTSGANSSITEVKLNGTVITPNLNGYYSLGAYTGGMTKSLSVKGFTTSCINDTLKMFYGWDCKQLPTAAPTVSTQCNAPLNFILKPLPAKIDATITPLINTPPNPSSNSGTFGSSTISMCTPFPVELVINSAVQGTIYDVLANTKLPPGISYIAGSAYYEHPIGSTPIAVSSAQESALLAAGSGGTLHFDVQQMSNNAIDSLQGTLNPITSQRQFKIRFLASTGCTYSGIGKVSTSFLAKKACNVNAINNGTVKSGSLIKTTAPSGMFAVSVTPSMSSINGCGVSSNGSITIHKTDAIIPTSLDSIRISVPSGIDLNSISCTACNPILQSPTIVDDGTTKYLSWNYPSGNVTGTITINFSATANAKAQCNTLQELNASITQQKVLSCFGTPCSNATSVEAANGTTNFMVNLPSFDMSTFTAKTFTASAPFAYKTTATIHNNSAVTSNGFTLVYAFDTDGDSVITAADILLGTETINTVLASGNSMTINKNFSTSQASNGAEFLVGIVSAGTDPLNSSCTCGDVYKNTTLVFDSNLPKPSLLSLPNNHYCFGQNVQLKAIGFAGATFNWTTPLGFTGTIDNSVSGESTITILNFSGANNGSYSVSQTLSGITSSLESIIVDGGTKPDINFVSTACVSNSGEVTVNATPSSGLQYAINGSAFQNSNVLTTTPGTTFVVAVKTASSSCIEYYTGNCVYCAPNTACANPPKDSLIAPAVACADMPIDLTGYFTNSSSITWSSSGTGSFNTTTCNASPCLVSYLPSANDLANGNVIITLTTNDNDGAGPCVAGKTSKLIKLINGLVAPTVSSNSILCSNDTLKLKAQGSIGTITWTGPSLYAATGSIQTIPNATPAMSGNYTATASASGCAINTVSASTNVTILSPPNLVVTAIGNAEACAGNGNGSIDVTVTGGSGNYTMCYNSNLSNCVTGTSAHFSWIAAGNYNVTVVDVACPNNVVSYPVTVAPGIIIPTPTVTSISVCAGDNLMLSGTLTAPATTINWTNSATSFNAIGNPLTLLNATPSMSGTYYAKALNAAGCASLQVPVTVTVYAKPIINHVQVNCIGGAANVDITATLVGATLAYSLDGITYQTLNLFTNVTPGNYTLYVKNTASNCATTLPISIINCACPTAPIVNVTAPKASCGLTGIPISSTFTNVSTASYSSTGSGSFSTTTGVSPLTTIYTPSATDLALGSVNLTLTTADPDGAGPCTAVSSTVLVVLNATLATPTITANQATYCTGDTMQLIATSNAPIVWTGTGGYTTNSDTAIIYHATPGISGTYTATVSGNGCASTSASYVVTIAPAPLLTVTPTSLPEGCANQGNGSIHVNVAGGTGLYNVCYVVSSNCASGASPFDFKYLAPATYTIYASDASCINAPQTSIVTVAAGMIVSPPGTTTSNSPVCEGDTLTFTTTNPATGGNFLWTDLTNNYTDSGLVISRPNAKVEMSATYKVQRMVDGCVSSPVFIDAKVYGTPNVISVDTLCTGTVGEDSGRITINALVNGGDAMEYALNDGLYQSSNVFNFLSNGLYTVKARPIGSNCETIVRDINLYCECVCNKQATVTVFPNPNEGIFTVNASLLQESQDISITVLDLAGRTVYQTQVTSKAGTLKHDIDIKSYAVGAYLLRVIIDTEKFIVPILVNRK